MAGTLDCAPLAAALPESVPRHVPPEALRVLKTLLHRLAPKAPVASPDAHRRAIEILFTAMPTCAPFRVLFQNEKSFTRGKMVKKVARLLSGVEAAEDDAIVKAMVTSLLRISIQVGVRTHKASTKAEECAAVDAIMYKGRADFLMAGLVDQYIDFEIILTHLSALQQVHNLFEKHLGGNPVRVDPEDVQIAGIVILILMDPSYYYTSSAEKSNKVLQYVLERLKHTSDMCYIIHCMAEASQLDLNVLRTSSMYASVLRLVKSCPLLWTAFPDTLCKLSTFMAEIFRETPIAIAYRVLYGTYDSFSFDTSRFAEDTLQRKPLLDVSFRAYKAISPGCSTLCKQAELAARQRFGVPIGLLFTCIHYWKRKAQKEQMCKYEEFDAMRCTFWNMYTEFFPGGKLTVDHFDALVFHWLTHLFNEMTYLAREGLDPYLWTVIQDTFDLFCRNGPPSDTKGAGPSELLYFDESDVERQSREKKERERAERARKSRQERALGLKEKPLAIKGPSHKEPASRHPPRDPSMASKVDRMLHAESKHERQAQGEERKRAMHLERLQRLQYEHEAEIARKAKIRGMLDAELTQPSPKEITLGDYVFSQFGSA